MPITRIAVSNFKSFSELDVTLSSMNVVIGSNASGKSNFISIFRFLRDIARNGLSNAIAMQGGPEYLRNSRIGLARPLSVRVDYNADPGFETIRETEGSDTVIAARSSGSTYEFSVQFHEPGRGFSIPLDQLTIRCQVFECKKGAINPEKEGRLIGEGSIVVSSSGGFATTTITLPPSCPFTANDIIPPIYRRRPISEKSLLLETPFVSPLPHAEKFFDQLAVYDIDPKLPRKGVVITGRSELEEDGGNLALVIKIISENPEKKRKLGNLIKDVLPFIEDFSVQKFMDVSLIMTMRERYARQQDLPASSLSDGTITIFALIVILYFEDKPFIIIEEPVSHIHPFLVGRLLAMMKEVSGHRQLMITTHSTEVVRHADLNDILLITRDKEGFSAISRPADKEEVKTFLENDVGIEELYAQNLLGL
ncbi:MAG TPA: AAA family ATPase [Methanoregulaceae archaeon]|nr:AAA family ATPase [Methanoregulaceae archaeon]HPD75435.1 AAA family ATPase [Methanoregulaceae archaeon]HRY75035.1 AAA family ATPase [Methanoregulaceae archaeon]